MRLHALSATAFGPFAGTVEVDFDDLSDAGLFLLTGPTGAGKSSILDAVCFALYGDVPGDRGGAKRLRSDQAAPDAAPSVELELTLAGRRLRVVRSPAWERAKRRGQGTTRQQASVVVSEQRGEEWVALTTRLDEAGQLVSGLLGMNLTQFTQVALLPQGRFMAFLRASSEERHQLLQRLFRTGRFEAAERWLRDRRLTLRRESETQHQVVSDLASRLSEADEEPLPDRWDIHDLTPAADDGSLRWWSEGLRARAERARRTADDEVRISTVAEAEARLALDRARERAAQLARWAAARDEEQRLLGLSDEHAARVALVDRARRAAAVTPIRDLADSARATAATLSSRTALAHELVLETLGPAAAGATTGGRVWAVSIAEAAAGHLVIGRSLQPLAGRLAQLRAELPHLQARREGVAALHAVTAEQVGEAPALVEALRADADASRQAAALLPAATGRRERLTAAVAAAREVADLAAQVESAHAARAAAGIATRAVQEAWFTLHEARLEGMAAELAAQLAVGGSCPVCGSANHPHLAVAVAGASDGGAEKAALALLDDAKALEHLRDQEHRDLATQLAGARGRAGDRTLEDLGHELGLAVADLADLTTRAAHTRTTAARLATAEQSLAVGRTRLTDLTTQLAELDTRVETVSDETARLAGEIGAALAGTGFVSTADLLAAAADREHRARELTAALDGEQLAHHAAADAAHAAEAAALAQGFASVADAMAACMTETDLARAADEVAAHESRLAAVAAVLAEPGAVDRDESPTPDVAQLDVAHRETAARLASTREELAGCTSRTARLTHLVAELDGALARWAPLRAELDLVTGLSALVEGKSADNRWQMRLSAYVLAYRLGQVVAAANERLHAMSDQRYALEHTGVRGVGETRGGLSLLVRDDWSGERRDPATLSGGETFVVSLALALGLADVICAEAGGVELDTLFVDEGFGSLDADTLDDVMDTLDGLRDGGRVVGVVSHVAEMRDRIPTRLVVTKSRAGSQVSVVR